MSRLLCVSQIIVRLLANSLKIGSFSAFVHSTVTAASTTNIKSIISTSVDESPSPLEMTAIATR
ncbi:hypothetical protein BCR33DRAFT_714662 [Rhizoclosmatium globosum]|uniref:Uncharacterized protein n=1 Tax=Rhizoclosmatium globosum TaxID=329046 RepID=A0A1Y2CPK2_9FUNG|nr:hypothetical protein BCR33DRAFT_714662 [Rhizoclosmatium globosum]|eukprot:ORY48265.1 hypothetical protein BCR33DRAFT_714662 [Rhizoclosmatium globosum]